MPLHNTSYFDPISMTIIDPMHNLYLGSAKCLIHLWSAKGLNTSNTLIQSRVDLIQVPHYVGRIPHKIDSSFSGFTTDQFNICDRLWQRGYFAQKIRIELLTQSSSPFQGDSNGSGLKPYS